MAEMMSPAAERAGKARDEQCHRAPPMHKASAESPAARGDTVISDAELTEAIEQIEKHVISGQPVP